MVDVRRGMPDTDRLLKLLDEAFDGWGDEELLRWKYDQYPGFDPDEHAFYVERDGDLAAFRRMFGKRLAVGGRTIPTFNPDGRTALASDSDGPTAPGVDPDGGTLPAFGLGDTAVAEAYRGQGLYSALHSTTVERCREHGVDLVLTFNRTNNVTFAANRDRGWRYRTLPLQMRILSPERVLAEYVDLVVDDWPRVKRAIDLAGDRVTFVVDGSPLPVSALGSDARSDRTAAKHSIRVPVPASAVRRAVRAFGRQSGRETLASLLWPSESEPSRSASTASKTSGTRAATGNGPGRTARGNGGEATTGSRSGTQTTVETSEQVEVTVTDFPDDLERVRALYEETRGDAPVSFRRDAPDLRHLCRYPAGRRVLLAERGGDLRGFAVLGTRRSGEVVECRVLDAVAADSATFRRLVAEIERVAVERGHDVVLLLSHRDAGREWVRIEKQVVMWDRPDDGPELAGLDADWHVGLYDVV